MRFKKSTLVSYTTTLENEIIQSLHIFGRADANIDQIWLAVNHYAKKIRNYKHHKPKIREAVASLVKKRIIFEKEYKGGLKHYLLEDYLSDYERSVYI